MATIKIGSDGTFVKPAECKVGQRWNGQFLGLRDGQFGPIGDLRTADGVLAFGSSVLTGKLQRVRPGASVEIVFLGAKTSPKSNRLYNDFELSCDSADVLPASTNGRA